MRAKALVLLVSLVVLAGLGFAWLAAPGGEAAPARDHPRAHLPVFPAPTDHAAFFTAPFADGPSVTKACLACHEGAAKEVMATTHWTWEGAHAKHPDTGAEVALGKRTAVNNFCIGIAANWERCTSCHVGYGWRDDGFLGKARPVDVDCLVCHDTSGTYQKDPVGAGAPDPGTDLLVVARSVGRTTRASCGTCHFKGGGGDGVKHGDLDETMYFPQERVDVHMGRHGLRCADCHRTEHHAVKGRLLPPSEDLATRVACADCHVDRPHGDARLDAHTATVACQTCHIPEYAVETGTKEWWDWSKAGRDGDPAAVAEAVRVEVLAGGEAAKGVPPRILDGMRRVGTDPDLRTHYDKKKGLFLIARRQVPEYRWYDGATARHVPGQHYDGPEPLPMNEPQGRPHDPRARIWPFKVHRGRQPFDGQDHHLLVPHTHGPGGYWTTFDWEKALRAGAAASGIPYSGTLDWISTAMWWPQNHMVQSKEKALRCADCHGTGGRMDWKALGYPGDPAVGGGRVQLGLVDGATGGAK